MHILFYLIKKDKNNGQLQKMPLPYKVAKSLDPVIYRNTAFDAWLSAKKGIYTLIYLGLCPCYLLLLNRIRRSIKPESDFNYAVW